MSILSLHPALYAHIPRTLIYLTMTYHSLLPGVMLLRLITTLGKNMEAI